MSSSEATASWHPAMRPNSYAATQPTRQRADSETHALESHIPDATETSNAIHEAPKDSSTHVEEESYAPAQPAQEATGADEWFPDYNSSSPWLEQTPHSFPPVEKQFQPEATSDDQLAEEEVQSTQQQEAVDV